MLESSLSWWGRHGSASTRQLVTLSVPTVRKQRVVNAGAQLSASLCSLQDLSPQDAAAHVYRVPFQVNTKRHAWRFVSYLILDPVKLAVDINHHVSDAFKNI